MTDTITLANPTEFLMELIVALLAPMFLSTANGDITYARVAASETVNAYRAQTCSDLLTIAQIIAFGLAALGSLSLSMADDLSPSMTLRLRANAISANRAAEQCHRALARNALARNALARNALARNALARNLDDTTAQPEPPPNQAFPDTAAIAAGVEQLRQHSAKPPVIQPDAIPNAASNEHRDTLWANAMAGVAADIAASLPGLKPLERRAASMRLAAMSSVASQLLAGQPDRLSGRFDPGYPDQSRQPA
jgi:hypothetical protein